MPKLKDDVFSNNKSRKYGFAGDEVVIIKEYGTMAIVEDTKKNRYSTLLTNLTDAKPVKKAIPVVETPEKKKQITKPPKVNVPPAQTKLF